jgi:hypothetical protein
VLAYTGKPFTPSVSNSNVQNGDAIRPDRLGSGKLDAPTIEKWFDTTAFQVVPPSAFRFGNSGRNILIGPGKLIADASVFKEFGVREGQRLQFRAEFFNLPNRANFGDPATAVDQPTGGGISSADPGRQIQLGLKYLF